MLRETKREAVTLKSVGKKLLDWRQHREKRGPIPQALLSEVSALTKNHPMGLLARTLRINYNTLKKSIAGNLIDGSPRHLRGRQEPPAFVEIPMKPGTGACVEWAVEKRNLEIETPQGYKIRVSPRPELTDQIEEWLRGMFGLAR